MRLGPHDDSQAHPNVTDITEIARAAERAVAEADGQAALEGWWRDG